MWNFDMLVVNWISVFVIFFDFVMCDFEIFVVILFMVEFVFNYYVSFGMVVDVKDFLEFGIVLLICFFFF